MRLTAAAGRVRQSVSGTTQLLIAKGASEGVITTPDGRSEQLVDASDQLELGRLVTEAAWRLDHEQADTLDELFVDDGELIMGQTVLRGRDAIREWGLQFVASHPFQCVRHVCANMRFVVDGRDAAIGTTVLMGFMVAGHDRPTTLPWTVGEYDDRFVRTSQGWRLARRHWNELFGRPADRGFLAVLVRSIRRFIGRC